MVTDAYKVLDNHNHLDPSAAAPIKFLVTAMFLMLDVPSELESLNELEISEQKSS